MLRENLMHEETNFIVILMLFYFEMNMEATFRRKQYMYTLFCLFLFFSETRMFDVLHSDPSKLTCTAAAALFVYILLMNTPLWGR